MPDDAPPAPPALNIVEQMLPIVQAARAAGWVINIAIEWRSGECFSVSGHLPPPDGR